MDAIEFYTNGGSGGYNISKILKKETDSYMAGGGATFHIPLGLYYNQFIESSTVLLDDVIKSTVFDDDAFFSSAQKTRKNKLRLKTTKKHK
jgi:hypothetical protein